jgi:phytoene/squalene synthetase
MPVGRFVLDLHGESRMTWPANDALCAALQVINHLQDCGKDYRELDRVYLPVDALSAAGASVEALAQPQASPALRTCLADLAGRSLNLLADSRPLPMQVRDTRLALEIAVIQAYAQRLAGLLAARDPLSENVHLGKAQFAGIGLIALIGGLARRLARGFSGTHKQRAASPP